MLTGMSSQGLTVHEANLESNDISFFGFPWLLRLRYIMSYAKNLQEGVDLWMNTNSTVGFNHGIGSGKFKFKFKFNSPACITLLYYSITLLLCTVVIIFPIEWCIRQL